MSALHLAVSALLAASGGGEVVFEGMCDASAAVAVDAARLLVADDEENVLRVYDARAGGPPLASVDLSAALGLSAEADIEGGARVGERAYWVTSHGRRPSGKPAPERRRFFATTVDPKAPQLAGKPSASLLEDLLRQPALTALGLARAAELPPREEGGLNLEGLAARPDGALWLGFRNPQPQGKALLVALLNPAEVVEGKPGRFGPPVLLELGGLGIRAMTPWGGGYLIAAGKASPGGKARLFRWDGEGAPQKWKHRQLDGLTPEAFFAPPGGEELLVLSDDGNRELHGEPCKRLGDPAKKRFRGIWLRP